MKTNGKTIIIVAVMIVVASLLLSASVVALAGEAPEDEAFAPGESAAAEIPAQVEAPKSVADFIQEQSVFKTVENGKLTLYTQEQFEKAVADIENGDASRMNEQELKYLINDSLQIYRQSSEIVLTNAFLLPGFSYLFDADYLASLPDKVGSVIRVGDDAIISPQGLYGIYFRGEGKSEEQTLLDMQCIIVYRAELAGSGLVAGSEKDEFQVNGSSLWKHTLSGDTSAHKNYYGPTSCIRYERICFVSFDENGDDAEEPFFVYAWDLAGSGETAYIHYGGNGAAFYTTKTYYTDDNSATGYKCVDMSDTNGAVAAGNKNDLMINGYKFNRNFMTDQVKCLVPGYDTDTRTALLDSGEFSFEIGMSFAELINEYGVPYTSYEEGKIGFNSDTLQLTGNLASIAPEILIAENPQSAFDEFKYYAGYYVTTDGKLFTVYFSHDGEFTVTGFDCKELY